MLWPRRALARRSMATYFGLTLSVSLDLDVPVVPMASNIARIEPRLYVPLVEMPEHPIPFLRPSVAIQQRAAQQATTARWVLVSMLMCMRVGVGRHGKWLRECWAERARCHVCGRRGFGWRHPSPREAPHHGVRGVDVVHLGAAQVGVDQRAVGHPVGEVLTDAGVWTAAGHAAGFIERVLSAT